LVGFRGELASFEYPIGECGASGRGDREKGRDERDGRVRELLPGTARGLRVAAGSLGCGQPGRKASACAGAADRAAASAATSNDRTREAVVVGKRNQVGSAGLRGWLTAGLAVWMVTGSFWGAVGYAAAPKQAVQILRKAAESEGQIALKGEVSTTVQIGDEQVVTRYQLLQKPPYMFKVEYLEPEGLAGQKIVSNGVTRWLYDENANSVFISNAPNQPSLKTKRLEELASIAGRFKVQFLGVEKIAGRDAYVIRFVRKRHPFTSRKFWVDKENFVLLRSEHLGPDGTLVMAKGFESVEFPEEKDIEDEEFTFEPPEGARVVQEPEPFFITSDPLEAQKRVAFQIRLPSRRPPDFRLQDICLLHFREQTVVWLRYTDSLNYFSIFERMLPPGAVAPSDPLPPQTVVGFVGDLNVAVVGTLPVEFLFWVADSLSQ